MRRHLKLFESKLGPNHPDTLNSRKDLAVPTGPSTAPTTQSRYRRRHLKLFESKLGPDHPDTLINRTNLGIAYRAAGRTCRRDQDA